MPDKKFINTIKKELIAEKERIEEELKKFTQPDDNVKDDHEAIFPDYGDKKDENALEVSTFSQNLSLEKRFEASLEVIQKALDRIGKGIYGTCELCESTITKESFLDIFASGFPVPIKLNINYGKFHGMCQRGNKLSGNKQ